MGSHCHITARSRRPFAALSPERWINLALAAFLAFYVIQVALDLIWNNFCGHLGIDYCAFWSAGRVASLYGYAKAYEPAILAGVQSAIMPATGTPPAISPVAYLPIFLLPFQALALLPPGASFWIWTVLNAVCFVAYLRFFSKSIIGNPLPGRLLTMFALSLPVYWNFFDGQVNVWLMICLGEFMRRAMLGQPFRSGLWLGGLLLKPQLLLLLVCAILLQRSSRALAGLAASAAGLLAGSLALIGTSGVSAVVQVWIGFARGMPTNDVPLMMNWRMLGLHLANWFSPALGWSVAAAGIIITIAAGLYLWRRQLEWKSSSAAFALLGTLAATNLVAWHSHIHMAMILIPPMLVLLTPKQVLSKNVLDGWVVIPAASYLLAYVLVPLVKVNILPGAMGGFLDFLRGDSEFAMNAWILVLAIRDSRGHQLAAIEG